MLGSRLLFYHFSDMTIAVRNCSKSASGHQKQEKSHCGPTGGSKNDIIVFLINETSDRECCHGNKMFHILELLLSCFISGPSFT